MDLLKVDGVTFVFFATSLAFAFTLSFTAFSSASRSIRQRFKSSFEKVLNARVPSRVRSKRSASTSSMSPSAASITASLRVRLESRSALHSFSTSPLRHGLVNSRCACLQRTMSVWRNESSGLRLVMSGSRMMPRKISETMSSAVCQSSPYSSMSQSISHLR